MTLIEYLYNVFFIVCIVDLIVCIIQISSNVLVAFYGLHSVTRVKIIIEKFVVIIYIAYIIYKILYYFKILG